jgi:hypothetical protein
MSMQAVEVTAVRLVPAPRRGGTCLAGRQAASDPPPTHLQHQGQEVAVQLQQHLRAALEELDALAGGLGLLRLIAAGGQVLQGGVGGM